MTTLNNIRNGVVCVCKSNGTRDSPRVAKAKQRFQQIRDRRADNMRRTSTFFSDIGGKDIEYFSELHEEIVCEAKSALDDHREWAANIRNTPRSTDQTYVDVDAVFNDGEETIFDN